MQSQSEPGRCNALLLSFVWLFAIGFGVWLFTAGRRYREEYAQATQDWHVGGVRMVELTLVKNDRRNLACASDQTIAGLHCGYRGALMPADSASADDPHVLQPYNTTQNELLLGAGLWTSPGLKEPLPEKRFTAVCNFHIEGVMKSASTRFDVNGSFMPLGKTVAAGAFTDCVLPQ